MSGFVYIWHDMKKNRWYVGSHWGSPNDGYVCSSKLMMAAYTRRSNDFRRRIISVVETSRSDLLKEEERWLQMIKSEERKTKYYNLNLKTHHWHASEDGLKTVGDKISRALKGKKHEPGRNYHGALSEEHRKNLSEAGKGRVFDEETRRKISEANLGRKCSDEFKARRAELNRILYTGKPRPQSYIDRMTGKLWWNNGVDRKRSEECPGEGWIRGKKICP